MDPASTSFRIKRLLSRHASPDFLVIGAMKAGTTSLFHYLGLHPQIRAPKMKEPAYFAWRSDRSFSWYLANFPLKRELGKGQLTFEATPGYLFFPESARAIHRCFPRVKLIAVLRDPVERAYSHWKFYHSPEMEKRNPTLHDPRTFEEAVGEELEGKCDPLHQYLSRGRYAEQLDRYYEVFPKDRLLLLDFSLLEGEVAAFLGEVCRFLSIENIYAQSQYSGEVDSRFLTSPESVSGLDLNRLSRVNATPGKWQGMERSTRDSLDSYFAEPDRHLQELTGRKFSWME